jgi:rhamnogalacturonyl hydrolase YesR
MATIDILEVIPASHPRRGQLLTIIRDMVAGFARYQDYHGLAAFLIMNEQLMRTGG